MGRRSGRGEPQDPPEPGGERRRRKCAGAGGPGSRNGPIRSGFPEDAEPPAAGSEGAPDGAGPTQDPVRRRRQCLRRGPRRGRGEGHSSPLSISNESGARGSETAARDRRTGSWRGVGWRDRGRRRRRRKRAGAGGPGSRSGPTRSGFPEDAEPPAAASEGAPDGAGPTEDPARFRRQCLRRGPFLPPLDLRQAGGGAGVRNPPHRDRRTSRRRRGRPESGGRRSRRK